MADRSASRRTWSWGILLPVLGLAVLFVTLPDAPETPRTPAATTSLSGGQSGLLLGLDPDSGAPIGMPEHGLSAKLALPALSRSDAGLVQEVLPGGAVRMDLQGRFQSASVARLNPTGGVETLCTEDAEQAQAFLDRRDTPARKLEVK